MFRLPALFTLLLYPICFFAQHGSQQIDLKGATAVRIYAAFSSVEITTGGRDAIGVEHNVILDGEEREDLRRLVIERENGVLLIRELRPSIEMMRDNFVPRAASLSADQLQVKPGAGRLLNSVMVDATLKVVVPANIPVSVETEYGGISAVNVSRLVSASAKYGSVDVVFEDGTTIPDLDLYSNYGAVGITIPPRENLDLDLVTEYGSLLSDMEIDMDDAASTDKEFYQHLIGRVGSGGSKVTCEAPYGNVYLREGE